MDIIHTLHLDDPRVMAAQVTGFVLLWLVLAKYLFRPVMGLLKTREQEIRDTYASAEGAETQAKSFRSDYEGRLANVETEARTRLQTAVREAQNSKDDILADARTRSEEILRRTQEDLAREREKTLASIREEVVDLSLAAAGKLIEKSLDEAEHRKMVNDFIDRIGAPK